jgi:Pla-1/cef family extracellular lipase
MGDKLTFGVDYVLSLADDDTVNVIPLKPFKAAQGHMLVITDALLDTSGKGVEGSITWDLVKQDINTRPLSSDAQLQLQALVNTYISSLETVGFTRDEISYVQVFTTQSTDTVLSTIKKLQVSEFAQRLQVAPETAPSALPAISVTGISASNVAMESLGIAATLFEGSVTLPYYSPVPSAENPLAPVNEFWESACTSGIILLGAGDALQVATEGPNAAMCQAGGLNDVRINGEKIDTARNLTKFSPIPQMKGRENGRETLDVQMTVPSPEIAARLGSELTMPEGGWPVVMLVHGITSKKEDMLAIAGSLSLAGFATVAIDQPIHGSRGFDLDGVEGDELNASTVSATHFLNLGSLPTARDNSRQAVADLLGVRLGLNAVVDMTDTGLVNINGGDVSVMGVSLGAITGGMFVSIANTPFDGPLAPLSSMYNVQAASLESPGGGLATFLLESVGFGPLVKGSLLSQASPDFQAAIAATYGTTDITTEQLEAFTPLFLAGLTPEQTATVNAVFAQFAFAAQTVTDSSDPVNYFATLSENTPVHMMTVVGDGTDANKPDQVIPVTTSLPLSGQLPLAQLMQLESIVSTKTGNAISGLVKFSQGAHASSLSPASSPATTAEMQTQVATYLGSKATVLPITNTDVISTN